MSRSPKREGHGNWTANRRPAEIHCPGMLVKPRYLARPFDNSCQLMQCGGMAYSQTDYYDGIINRQIKSGRASNKTEVVHQALELLDTLTRGRGPAQSTFEGREDLETLIRAGLASGPAKPMTPERWKKICGK